MVVYHRLERRGGVQIVVMMIIQGISRLHPLHRRISVSAAAIGITAIWVVEPYDTFCASDLQIGSSK